MDHFKANNKANNKGGLTVNLKVWADNTKDYFAASPLKNLNKQLPKDDAQQMLGLFDSHLKSIAAKLTRPMNVVIMGEVKAGKSTILNAILQKRVSPTDVLETTAAITEVYYAPQEEAAIMRAGKADFVGTIEAVYDNLSGHQGDLAFFEGDVLVRLGIPLESLKEFHIVDTPGLLTITDANIERTRNFTQEADVVLWVLNSNHLGQSDVAQELAAVARLGKPVIGILNRIDEVDAPSEKLLSFVRRNLGHYFAECFAVKGLQAFEARMNGDAAMLSDSGFSALLSYLRDNIELKADEVYEESIRSSMEALLAHQVEAHQTYVSEVQLILSTVEEQKRDLRYHSDRIQDQVESYILREWQSNFLENERREILQLAQQGDSAKINEKAAELFSESTINAWLERVQQGASDIFAEEWRKAVEDIDTAVEDKVSRFYYEAQEQFAQAFAEVAPTTQSAALSGLGQGATIAGAAGLGLASYAALAGPYAAYITIGSAAAAYIPPLAIAGAVIGVAAKLLQHKKEKQNHLASLESHISQVKQTVKENMLQAYIIPDYKRLNAEMLEHLLNAFTQGMNKGWTTAELKTLATDLNLYCNRGKNMLQSFRAEAEGV